MADIATHPTPRANWPAIYGAAIAILGAALAFLLWATPVTEEGAKDWFAPMIPGGWMAWTFPVALFFWVIASLIILFTILAVRYPETPRHGILRIETTRGDRLFISLIGSAFICLGWLFFAGPPLWWALALCLVYWAAVFRWV
jgi:predicted small integral membrane protein